MEYSLISIGRQFGSGGHKVGQLIADELRIPYYDKELLTLAAERGALPEQKLAKYDEKKHNNYFYELNYRGNEHAHKGIPTAEALFELQSDIIRKLAESRKRGICRKMRRLRFGRERFSSTQRIYCSASGSKD